MSSVIITTSGTGFVAAAGTAGPYFPLRYFLPIYDSRIDGTIRPAASTVPTSACDPTSATDVMGEKIYNVSALNAATPGSYVYSVEDTEYLVWDSAQVLSGTGSDRVVSANGFDSTTLVNRLNGVPLTHTISGTSITYLGSNWYVPGYGLISGNNNNPYSPATNRNRFFRVQSYAPITSAAGGNARGLFKLRIPSTVGTFKFNKIAIYAARFNADGSEDTGTEPVLFAIAALKNPVLKTTDSVNVNNFELDLELQFASQAVVGNVSFLSNDYWNRVAGEHSLWFDGNVAIGAVSAVAGAWQPYARLNITVGPSEGIPSIRLTNNNIGTYMDNFFSSSLLQVTNRFVGSDSIFLQTLKSSGSTRYAQSDIYQDATIGGNLTNYWKSTFVDSLSGTRDSTISFQHRGYLTHGELSVDNVPVVHIRARNSPTIGRMVFGVNAHTAYEDTGRFLTINGGTALIGSNILSGNAQVTSDLTVNGVTYMLFQQTDSSATFNGVVNITSRLIVSGNSTFNNALSVSGQMNIRGNLVCFDELQGTTNGDITGFNDITMSRDGIFNRDLQVGYNATIGVLSTSYGQLTTPRLLVVTSANFADRATFQGLTTVNGDLNVNGVTTLDDTGVNGLISFFDRSFIYANMMNEANLSVSGLCALYSNLNMDKGDVQIRRKGYGLRANITTVAAVAGGTYVASFSTNNESFGIVTGWSTASLLRIETSKASSSSLIFYSIFGSTGTSPGHCIDSINDGVSFTLRASVSMTATVFWMIINPAT